MVRLVVWLLVLAVLGVLGVICWTRGYQHQSMGLMAIFVGAFGWGAFIVNGYNPPDAHGHK